MESENRPASSTANAIDRAQAAFRINTTISSHRWRQRQLYGLCRLLVLHRQELVKALSSERHSQSLYERELAVVLEDIAHHYRNTTKRHTKWTTSIKQHDLPVGVSILVVDSTNPIRFLFSTLAANIVVGNTVILTSTSLDQSAFWLILQRKVPNYLDAEAIHVVPSLIQDHSLLKKANLITVLAELPDPYDDILHLSNSQFISTKGASSLVVVDEGPKSFNELANHIYESYIFHGIRPEAVSAVFIRGTEIEEFRKSFNAISTRTARQASTDLDETNLLKPFTPGSLFVELTYLVGPHEKRLSLAKAIDLANKAGSLLIVSYQSIDHVIDALRRLTPAPTNLTLLHPYDKASSLYFYEWTISKFYSLGTILPVIPHGSNPDVLFPPGRFGRTRTSLTGSWTGQIQSQPLDDVVRRVQAVVKEPQEALNQTVDFFIYMNRVAMGVGATLGAAALTGLYVWYTRRAR